MAVICTLGFGVISVCLGNRRLFLLFGAVSMFSVETL